MNPQLLMMLLQAGVGAASALGSAAKRSALAPSATRHKSDAEQYQSVLNTILSSSDYSPLERGAYRQLEVGQRQLGARLSAAGLSGSSLAASAQAELTADIMARLASEIQRDRQFRAGAGVDLYKTLLNAKAQGEAADAQMWGGALAGLGQVAGTMVGSDWFGKWLNSLLSNKPIGGGGGGNARLTP